MSSPTAGDDNRSSTETVSVRQALSGGRNAPAPPLIQGNRCAHAEEHPERDDGGGLGDCVYAASDGANEAVCTCGYALDRLGREVNLLEIHAGVLGHLDDAIASGVSVWGHSTEPAPTPYSQAARGRARRSAPVAPRGSERSRRAVPQRQTRPEARTHGQARLQAVVLGPEITPHSLWKLWVTRMCELHALHASGWATRSRRDSTRSRPVRQPPKRSGRPDLRG